MASAAILFSTISVIADLISKIKQAAPSSSSANQSHQTDLSFLEALYKLNTTFNRIKAVLHDSEKREIEDESVKLWLSELKEVAYDAEDVLDEFHYEFVLRPQAENRALAAGEVSQSEPAKKKVKVEKSWINDESVTLWPTNQPKMFCYVAKDVVDGDVEASIAKKIIDINEELDEIPKALKNAQQRHDYCKPTEMNREIMNLSLSSRILEIAELIEKTQSSSLASAFDESHESDKTKLSLIKYLHHLKETFNRIKSLVEMEKSVEAQINNLRKMACKAEDVLDALQAQAKGRVSILIKASPQTGLIERINKINGRLDEIIDSKDKLHLKEGDGRRYSDATRKYPPPTSHIVNEMSVYGRDNDKGNVIELLLAEDNPRFSVVAIVGKGGLGKTTLAQLVYKDDSVSNYFDIKMWIFVSLDFDIVRLSKKMVENITRESCNITDMSLIQKILMEKVKGKKLFMVLDDVWNEQLSLWESLIAPLNGAELVRVLVTTRNNVVANKMKAIRLYHPSILHDDEGWKLFDYYASRSRDGNKWSEELMKIGRKIVEKCEGLPLTIKLLGSQLRNDEESWNDVLQSNLWDVTNEDMILHGLMLSYIHMPMHLKPCFLFCSIFPKGYEFCKEELVRMWMAQDYIQPRSQRSLEYVGSDYFDELVSRSFFDLFEHRYTKEIYAKMHDNIYDLAKYVSKDEYVAIDGRDQHSGNLKKVRHMYVSDTNILFQVGAKIPLSQKRLGIKMEVIRTLICETLFTYEDRSVLKSLVEYANHIQFMQLNLWSVEDSFFLLENVTQNEKQLRYLSIHSGQLTSLPSSICFLYNLQILEISRCHALKEIPEEIGELFNLQCLRLIECHPIKRFPDSISQLHILKTLVLERCSKFKILSNVLGNLCKLQQLNVFGTKVIFSFEDLKRFSVAEITCNNIVKISGINKLKDIVNLKGDVSVFGLENIVTTDDARKTNIKVVDHIEALNLHWLNTDYYEKYVFPRPLEWRYSSGFNSDKLCFLIECCGVQFDKVMMAEDVLENLRPHNNLKTLKIVDYPGSINPTWIDDPSFTQLTEITFKAPNVTSFPAFGQLPFLKDLTVEQCPVRSIGYEFYSEVDRRSKTQGVNNNKVVAFPALESLHFRYLKKLERWHGVLDSDFPQLRNLTICGCELLTSMMGIGHFTNLEILLIRGCSKLKPLFLDFVLPFNHHQLGIHDCQTKMFLLGLSMIKMVEFLNCGFESLLGIGNLTRLEELRVFLCGALEHLSLRPDIVFPSMLKILYISYCSRLTSLLGLDSLTNLEVLELHSCHALNHLSLELPDIDFPYILKRVHVSNCTGLTSLLGLGNLTRLEELAVHGCDALEHLSLESDIEFPSMLKKVDVSNCTALTSLHGLHKLTSLEVLTALRCPSLELPTLDSRITIYMVQTPISTNQ